MSRVLPTYATLFTTGWFVGGLLAGALAGRALLERWSGPYDDLAPLARVVGTVEAEYIEPIERDALVEAAIHGVLDRLDPQSRWLGPKQLRALRDDAEGTTSSLGIEVKPHKDGVAVTRVVEGSPASEKGLTTGDRILEVDGRTLAGMALTDVQRHLDDGTSPRARLTVLRDGWANPRTIETERDRLPRNVVTTSVLDQQVIYARLIQFQDGSANELYAALVGQARHLGGFDKTTGVVLDLRDNPGGLLSEAVAVTDLFLDEGVIVRTQGRAGAWNEEVHSATQGGIPAGVPVVVLVNGMSASASEIVAGAFQDTGRGVLVGQPTYGKGTVQKVYVPDRNEDAAIKLTVGRYTTPSGQPVAPKEGRVPDYLVAYPTPPGPVTRLMSELRQLDLDPDATHELTAIVATLPEDPEVRPIIDWDAPVAQRLRTDPQLQAAWRLLTP
ncbi:MAG: S41 family peptidase [Myxococcota bacterium]